MKLQLVQTGDAHEVPAVVGLVLVTPLAHGGIGIRRSRRRHLRRLPACGSRAQQAVCLLANARKACLADYF
jgi:hypothetical protein